jgi:hypothetical protein
VDGGAYPLSVESIGGIVRTEGGGVEGGEGRSDGKAAGLGVRVIPGGGERAEGRIGVTERGE